MNATSRALAGSETWAVARSSGSRLPHRSACCALSQTWRPSRSFTESSGVLPGPRVCREHAPVGLGRVERLTRGAASTNGGEERFGGDEIGGIEPFGEAAVDGG